MAQACAFSILIGWYTRLPRIGTHSPRGEGFTMHPTTGTTLPSAPRSTTAQRTPQFPPTTAFPASSLASPSNPRTFPASTALFAYRLLFSLINKNEQINRSVLVKNFLWL